MKTQKEIFEASEADSWFKRNRASRDSATTERNELAGMLKHIELRPRRLLEIGCSNGFRLDQLRAEFDCECFGIDPSPEAIRDGNARFPGINLQLGTADSLSFEDAAFDTIIFGFCLYLCDRKDLFKIACEADRCLRNEGTMVITDFHPPFPYKNPYSHHEGVYSYKMNYGQMFTWNPSYVEIAREIYSHSGFGLRDVPNERVGTVVLRKVEQFAYPVDPFRNDP